MSNQANTDLIERANQLISYWEGTMHARTLQRDIDANDLEALSYHVNLAAHEQAVQEEFTLTTMPDMSIIVHNREKRTYED